MREEEYVLFDQLIMWSMYTSFSTTRVIVATNYMINKKIARVFQSSFLNLILSLYSDKNV